MAFPKLDDQQGYLANYEAAVRDYNRGEFKTALVYLKNALQERPDHLPSRLLLGNTHMRLGKAADAEKELRIALRLGAAKDQVIVPLGNALLAQRRYQELLDTLDMSGVSAANRYEVFTLRGRAYLEMGQLEEAHAEFDRAIATSPDQIEAYLGKSQTFSTQGNYEEAEKYVDKALDRGPDDAEVLYEKGEIRRQFSDISGALGYYTKAIEQSPNHMRARLARASLNLGLGNNEAARDDSKFVYEAVLQDPDAALLYSQASMRLGDSESAKEALRRATDIIDRIKEKELFRQPGLLRIAALLSSIQGATEKANTYLDAYIELQPHDIEMRKISARVKLQLDDADGAIRTLMPVYKPGTQDVQLLFLLGQAYLQSERYGKALAVLDQAARLAPNSAELRTRLALGRIGMGDAERAVEDFGEAFNSSRDASVTAGIILTVMEVRQRAYDNALKTASRLVELQPKNPILHNLLGIVYLGRNEIREAYAAFTKALEVDERFVPALYNLGQIEQKTGRLDAAEQWYQKIIAINPQQVNALSALADIEIARGDYKDAQNWLEKAAAADREQTDPLVRLVELHLMLGNVPAARQEANNLANRTSENAVVEELLGRVELAAGNREGAAMRYRNASRYAGGDGKLLLQVAAGLSSLEEYKSAELALFKAAETTESTAANSELVELYLRQGNVESAQKYATQVLEREPDKAIGYALQAQIDIREKRYEEALTSYNTAFAKEPSRDILLARYQLLFGLGRKEEGLGTLEAWMAAHPEDTIAERNLALAYLEGNQRDKARARLESLVKTRPDDSLVLASLAQLYQQEGNRQARALAERAVKLSPNWSIAQDAYGWILVTEGEPEEGLKYLREAVSRDSNPLMRYHLAVALRDLGRTDEARTELEKIFRLPEKPPWIDSARKLHSSLVSEG